MDEDVSLPKEGPYVAKKLSGKASDEKSTNGTNLILETNLKVLEHQPAGKNQFLHEPNASMNDEEVKQIY
jgi:hypothetical protein